MSVYHGFRITADGHTHVTLKRSIDKDPDSDSQCEVLEISVLCETDDPDDATVLTIRGDKITWSQE